MQRPNLSKFLTLLLVFAAVWLGIRYVLPLILPFLLGAGIALAAEPMVRLLTGRLKLPRIAASGIGVTLALALLIGVLILLISLLVREVALLAGALPSLAETLHQGLGSAETFLLRLANRSPEWMREPLNQNILELFSSSSVVIEQLMGQVPGIVTSVLSAIPDSALTLGTAIISAFMISARLPALRPWVTRRLPQTFSERYLPALRRIRTALAGWLKAQVKLFGLSFLILALGLTILRIPYSVIWALGIAFLDALPLLGTGAFLLPWAFICLLQHNGFRAAGLVCIYIVAAATRSALEPRLVGRQLGMDSLMTLVALYAGYQLWGFGGMLLAPLLAVAAGELAAVSR